jgi:hypothetical protein
MKHLIFCTKLSLCATMAMQMTSIADIGRHHASCMPRPLHSDDTHLALIISFPSDYRVRLLLEQWALQPRSRWLHESLCFHQDDYGQQTNVEQ